MLTEAERLMLKGVTRLSVRESGGQEACAEACRDMVGRPQSFSDYGLPERLDRMIRLDVAAALDRFSGKPRFAAALAELSGHLLVRRPAGAGAGRLNRVTGAALRETSEVFARLGAALEDAKITRDEDGAIAREIDEAMARLAELKLAVHAEAEGDGE